MSESTAKIDVKKYSLYLYTKDLEKQGLAFLVFECDDENVKGVKIQIGKSERMDMTRLAFENLLAYNILELSEVVPKFVWKDFKKHFDK